MSDFFDNSGDAPTVPHEERRHLRIRARTQAVGFVEQCLPSLPRGNKAFGVFTSDFSRAGCGFLSSFQLFPGEKIRLLLPQFWLRLQVVRCRKLGHLCYEAGTLLISRNPSSSGAFQDIAWR